MLLSLWVVATLTFWMMHAIPGDPFMQERAIPEEILRSLYAHYGLDQPLWVQYGKYLNGLLHGDLGPSFKFQGRTVNDVIRDSFPVSFVLGFQALFISLCIGLSLGAISAFFHRRGRDQAVMLLSILGISVPSFLLATLLQYLFAMRLEWFPVARWGSFSHSVLPTLALAALPTAFIARLLRSTLLEVLQQDFILTARSKGISSLALFWRHALRGSLIPIITYLGPLTASILTGTFAVEKIFGIPGLGQWFIMSITNRDYTVIMGLALFYSMVLMFCVWASELLYLCVDPKLRSRARGPA